MENKHWLHLGHLAIIILIYLSQSCGTDEKPLDFAPPIVLVQGGDFERGDGQNYPKEKVTVNDFYIGEFEVTQREWRTVMGYLPNGIQACDNCPVSNVTMKQVQRFFKKLKQRTGINYRLPTQNEWEFAAKGGIRSHGYLYSGSNSEEEVGWIPDETDRLHPVGLKAPNELGIHDMTGNVREWTSSGYDGQQDDVFIIRGGSFRNGWHMSTNTWRDWLGLNYTDVDIGFRYALDAADAAAFAGACMFDTSTYKFTTEAIRRYNPNLQFFWDSSAAMATVPLPGGDTLLLHIGGCDHFGYSAQFFTDAVHFDDDDYLPEKAKWLAQTFFLSGFDKDYAYFIDKKHYRPSSEINDIPESKRRCFEIVNPYSTTVTNHIYEGFCIEKLGNRAVVRISGYIN